ncbi:kinesin light chain-like [Mizuhopecten yessoensis]|nr:kinesin light chain-like [Mizuhopecten yessoensis]
MALCRNNKNLVDEACVRIQFGSMLTNVKGTTSLAEKNYFIALDVLNEVSQSSPSGQTGDKVVRRSLALVYQRIGWNVGSQGRWQEALVYLDKAFHLEQELHMYYEELAISTIQSLSVFNTFLGNLELGLKFNKEAFRRRTAFYGTEEHPNVATLVNNLGLIYRRLGQKDTCLECFMNGLRLKRKTKATAKSIAISLENVALAFTDKGDHDQALNYLKEAYDLLDKTPNLYRDNRAYAYSIESEVLQKQARHAEAISRLKKAVNIIVREAPDEIFTSKLYFEIANSYFALENYPKAIAFCNNVFNSKHVLLREAPTCDRLFQSCKTAIHCHTKLGDDINRRKWYDEATREATRLIQIFRSYGKDEKVSIITNELRSLQKRFESDVESN